MKIPKAVDRLLTAMLYILTFAPFLVIGIICGDAVNTLYAGEDTGTELIILSALMLTAVLFFLVHLILHEGGHLIFGLMTGWKFTSFRIGNLVLAKQDGKMKWKKTTVVGTGGQCLMCPPDCEPQKCPFFLYLLGGGLINIVTGGIALLIGITLGGAAGVFLNIFGVMGIGTGVMNLFPAKAGGTMNDGYNIFIEFPSNKLTKEAHYTLLAMNSYLTSAEDTKNLPETVRNSVMNFDYSDLSNTGTANLLMYKAIVLQDEEHYDEAREIFERIYNSDTVLGLFKNEAACECMYFEIMGDCNAEKIEEIYTKKLSDYIRATSLYPSRKRLMYAYYLIYKNDTENAEKELEALKKTAESHPIRAEGCIELREAERVRARYENK